MLTRPNFARCQDVVKMRDQVEYIRTDLFKTSSEDKEEQRFQLNSRFNSTRLQDVFIKTNVWWVATCMAYPELFSS